MSALASQSAAKKKVPEKKETRQKLAHSPARNDFVVAKSGGGGQARQKPFSPPSLYLRLVVAGILGIAMVSGIFFSASQLKLGVGEIERKRGQMAALQEKEENLMMLSLILGSVKGEIPLIEKALPNEKEVVDFIKEVEDSGREISLENFNFESDWPQPDQAGNSYLEWTLEASGPLPKLEEFLTKLLNLPVLIRPKVIDIEGVDKEAGKLVFRAWLYVEPDFFEERE